MGIVGVVLREPYILPYGGVQPSFASTPRLVGAGASVLGRAQIGARASLGPLSVIRADGHFVKIGDDFSLGQNSTVHIAHEIYPAIIGDRVAVARNAVVHACTLGNDCVIEDHAVVLDGSVVEDNVVIERDSVVYPRSTLKSGFIYAGSPAKPVAPLTVDDRERRRTGLNEELAVAIEGSEGELRERDHPDIGNFIARTALLRGRIDVAANASVFFSCVLDAGRSTISIGANSNIQDNTTIRCDVGPVAIGSDTTFGHNVSIHDSNVGDRCLIGIGSVLAAGTVVEDDVLLAAGSTTTPGQRLTGGLLWAGRPARPLSQLDESKREMMRLIVEQYCGYAEAFRALQKEFP